jgi:hypothetical protein
VQTQYGPGKLLGARNNQLWYCFEGSEQSAWYWRFGELRQLVQEGVIKFISEVEAAPEAAEGKDASTAGSSKSLVAAAAVAAAVGGKEGGTDEVLSYAQFRRGLLGAQWTQAEDERLCRAVNGLNTKLDLDPHRIPSSVIEQHLFAPGQLFPGKPLAALVARYAALCVISRAAAVALPLLDFNPGDCRLPIVRTALKQFDICAISPSTRYCSASSAVRSMKHVIFTRTKMSVWSYAVKESTIPTAAPADEYERPDDMRELSINRIEARHAEKLKDSMGFSEKLRISVFGQLMAGIQPWDERALRRTFKHMQDGGQGRAFFVKFTGEGVDDQGGPYRAVFQTAVGEEALGLLELLVPCPNAEGEIGENRDRFLLNSALGRTVPQAPAIFVHLGKLVAMACRHNILVAMALPQMFWKPLAGEAVESADLQAIDQSLASSLAAILSGEMPQDMVPDLLVQAVARSVESLSSAAACAGAGAGVGAASSSSSVTATSSGGGSGAGGCCSTFAPTAAAVHGIVTHALALGAYDADIAKKELQDIVALIQQLRLTSQAETLKSIAKGIAVVVPAELLPMFSAEELERVFCGEADVDISVLQKATVYESVSPTDR